MKKYTRKIIDFLKQTNVIELRGIESEFVRHFTDFGDPLECSDKKPIIIECFGITNPNPHYSVAREKSHNYIIEYVESGTGYVEINNEKFTVNAGDVYFLYPNSKEKYYSDEKNPMKKYWVNFVSDDIAQVIETLKIKDIHHFPKCNLMGHFIQLYSLDEVNVISTDFYYFAYSTIISMLVDMKKSLVNKAKDRDIA